MAKDVSATDKRLVFSNWPEYIDEDDGKYVSTLTQFEKDTGIKVAVHRRRQRQQRVLRQGQEPAGLRQSTKRDLFALTDWMAARMIQVGWIQKLDASKVPNLHANIIDSLQVAGVGPQARLLRPVAERPDRHRVQQEQGRRDQVVRRAASAARTSRAASRC